MVGKTIITILEKDILDLLTRLPWVYTSVVRLTFLWYPRMATDTFLPMCPLPK